MAEVHIEESWKRILADEFEKPYFKAIGEFVKAEIAKGKTVFPPGKEIFNAFEHTPFDHVKVVILGQDPYHGLGQAHGLCFSVKQGIKPPPSLVNIFKEIESDLGIPRPSHGELTSWADQGVFLLNAILSVNKGEPASHKKAGWETFTDAVIKALSDHRVGLVFLLWGAFAQNKAVLIDEKKHFVLTAPHPSPFSADRGFFGCKHFSRTNEILKHEGFNPIDWSIE